MKQESSYFALTYVDAGVPEEEWLSVLQNVPAWTPPMLPTVVVAPHPDDEVLGAGGLIAAQRQRGVPVTVIAVTNGEAAYPDQLDLGRVREQEQGKALGVLGVEVGDVVRLGWPDGNLAAYEAKLKRDLSRFISPGSLIVAPWVFDAHPDHETAGRMAEEVAGEVGATVAFYFVWAWHRRTVEFVSAAPLHRFFISKSVQKLRREALDHHASQLHPAGNAAILPESVLGPMKREFETFAVHG